MIPKFLGDSSVVFLLLRLAILLCGGRSADQLACFDWIAESHREFSQARYLRRRKAIQTSRRSGSLFGVSRVINSETS
jgi:hypothetical protein